MGAYCTLYVAGVALGSAKNGIDPDVMLLFRSTDRCEVTLEPGTPEHAAYFTTPGPDDKWQAQTETQVVYRTRCRIVRDRLEVLGFSHDTARAAFQLALRREQERYARYATEPHWDVFKETGDVYASLTFDSWAAATKEIVERHLFALDRKSAEFAALPAVIRCLISSDYDSWLGIPVLDPRHIIRLVTDLVDADGIVEYDLTDLVAGGHEDNRDDLVAHAEDLLSREAVFAQRIIVLTEGAIDKHVLESSIALLTPHLADYFSFLDFNGARVAGGAGALAQMLKAFAAAGISNRVVAVFDNDTAGAEAIAGIDGIALAPNYAVIRYPNLEWLRKYPTRGPTGIVEADINGVAASLELYLGADVLRDPTGELIPVHWRGFNERMSRYQGTVMDKSGVLARFNTKLRAARDDPSVVQNQDWSGLRAIIDAMTRAASATGRDSALQFEDL